MKISVSHILTVIISAAILFFVSLRYPPLKNTLAAEKNGWASYRGKVTGIIDTSTEYYENGNGLKKTAILFSVKLYDGPLKNRTIKAVQMQDDFIALKSDALKKGDSVIILQLGEDIEPSLAENTPNQEIFDNPVFVFEEFYRFTSMTVLLFVFVTLLLVFGGLKGMNTLISLVFTCASIFCWFIPSIFYGANLYTTSITVCLFIIVMTVIIVNGINKKSLASITGCFGGVLIAALL
ncbi:MAG: YibE/F family protein, partial [Spirochaetaceae bacterium]|nr:YibE/F family protein [Spirochaetaceae bacterium]